MDKIKQTIEKLEHAQAVFMAQTPRNDAEARINDAQIEYIDFELKKYNFQLRKLSEVN